MKSKVKGITYLLPFLIMAFFIFVFLSVTMDNTIVIYSLQWWIFLVIVLGIISMFLFSFRKIPKIEIDNNVIKYISKGTQLKIEIAEITKIERVTSMINGWYSFRGGLKIQTEKEVLLFPFHVYSNELKILQRIYQSEDLTIEPDYKFSFVNFIFIKYFYRNFGSYYLVMALVLIAVLISKGNINIIGIVGISVLVLLMIAIFLVTSKFLKIENGYLIHISPLFLRSCKYDIKDIEYVNSKSISTGKNGAVKNLTIELTDKRILTLNAGLNRQKEIDKIAERINTRSNNVHDDHAPKVARRMY